MRKLNKLLAVLTLLLTVCQSSGQTLYFPPAVGSWQTLAPSELGWCSHRIDSLYNYLDAKNTKSFIVLKGGRIVLEKYFGSYTQDSLFYWASASKSLAAFITGIAKAKGYISLNATVSQYLGSGWSSASSAKEGLVKVGDLLKMTSGLEEVPPPPCDNEDSAKACLLYKVDAGARWAYHTGAYKKVQSLVSAAVGLNYNGLTTLWLKNKVGMGGAWFDQMYYSKARDMARFGLLNLASGVWQSDTVLSDTSYFAAMTRSSQSMNPAYGYLWWLNGKSFYLSPALQFQISGSLIPNAPSDLYAALGKNDQKIYVVPSSQLVIVRQGNSAEDASLALSKFDNKLWDYVNKLSCNATGLAEEVVENIKFWPNPVTAQLQISDEQAQICTILTSNGQQFELPVAAGKVNLRQLPAGLYQLMAVDHRPAKGICRFIKVDD